MWRIIRCTVVIDLEIKSYILFEQIRVIRVQKSQNTPYVTPKKIRSAI
jgi:hypothetical protein